MRHINNLHSCFLLFAAVSLSACAGTGILVDSPGVELTGIELTSASFHGQTFLLSFDVSNPNPFPLPVKAVDYRVDFDDRKFAGGKTQGKFTVPARGDDSFAISVDLDILNSASHLRLLIGGDFKENISYKLRGNFAVDIPFVKPIPFSNSGIINMTQTASDEFN